MEIMSKQIAELIMFVHFIMNCWNYSCLSYKVEYIH